MTTHSRHLKGALSAGRIVAGVFLYLVSILTPQSAWACSVCFLAKRENLMAYLGTGVLLSVLPFVLIGGVAWWLYRRMTGPGYDAMTAEEKEQTKEIV